jgi:hypothetical protein
LGFVGNKGAYSGRRGAFQELGSEGLTDGTNLFHAAFGKKRAVNLMAQALLD